jgi:hypothetical protein
MVKAKQTWPNKKMQPSCRTAALTWKIFRGNRLILVVSTGRHDASRVDIEFVRTLMNRILKPRMTRINTDELRVTGAAVT